MKPYIHAENSARKFGGVGNDYIDIHQFIDESKAHLADHRHRALLHSTFGCFIVEKVFGITRTNSNGEVYSTRDIAEQHCVEDLGSIPTVQDWLGGLPLEAWMSGGKREKIPSRDAINQYIQARKKFRSIEHSDEEIKNILHQKFLESGHSSFTWIGYVPYFNDGDPCVFRIGDLYFSDEIYTRENMGNIPEEDDFWQVSDLSILEDFGKDIIEDTFGSHHQVFWDKEKGFVEEFYDHS